MHENAIIYMEGGIFDKNFEVKVQNTWAGRSPRRTPPERKKNFDMGKTFSIFKIFKKISHDPRPTFKDLSKSVVRFVNGGNLMSNEHKASSGPCLARRAQVRVPPRSIFFTFYCLFLLILLEINSPSKYIIYM